MMQARELLLPPQLLGAEGESSIHLSLYLAPQPKLSFLSDHIHDTEGS